MFRNDEEIKDKLLFVEDENFVLITPPEEFSFEECLVFLGRSENEVLHTVRDNSFIKLIKLNKEMILVKVYEKESRIVVEFLNKNILNQQTKIETAFYIWDLFDLGQDMKSFYQLGREDRLLHSLIKKYKGLRMIGIPDLFEALTWAIMGQQINLTFAYTLKRRFVEKYGEKFEWNDEVFFLFPEAELISKLEVSDLISLQFTQRKAEYVIGIAKLMATGNLTKEKLLEIENYENQLEHLVSIRGVGHWTADYVLMKCLKETSALPIADVGLHNALKIQLGLEKKPTIDEIKVLAKTWKGWEAYVTFYLWRSLYS